MPDNRIPLTRQDGSVLYATPEQADKLRLLGYRDQTPQETFNQNTATAEEDYYTSTHQKLIAGAQNFASGLTLGASDALQTESNSTRNKRDSYNSGIAMAANIAGAVAPIVLSGGEAGLAEEGTLANLASKAPTARLARGASEIAGNLGLESKVARGLVAGGVEGSVYGGAGAVNHAMLTGDPLTAESVLHGIGWGTVFGMGLGAAGGALEGKGEAIAERLAKGESEAAAKGVSLVENAKNEFEALHGEVQTTRDAIKQTLKESDSFIKEAKGRIDPEMRDAWTELEDAYMKVKTAADNGKSFAKIEAARTEFSDVSKRMGEAFGTDQAAAQSVKAISDLTEMTAAHGELIRFPKTPSEFATMKEGKAEKLFAAVDAIKKVGMMPTDALKSAETNFGAKLGADSSQGLRAAWTAIKGGDKTEAIAGKPGVVNRLLQWVGGAKAYGVGASVGGPMGGMAAAHAVRHAIRGGAGVTDALVAAKNAVGLRISKAAASYLPKAGKAIQRVGPMVEPLSVKLDGSIDDSTKNKQDLAAARIKEMWTVAPNIEDRMYKSIEPIGAVQPELGPALHQASVRGFKAMLGLMPKDPGVVSGLRPIWKPSILQTSVMSRQLAVFQDPVGVVESMLHTGNFDPISIKALKVYAPNMYQELRLGVLQKVSDPGVMDKLDYHGQIGLGTLLDIHVHSSMRPEQIAASLQLFQQRSQPLPTPGAGAQSSTGGAGNSMATPAQITGNH